MDKIAKTFLTEGSYFLPPVEHANLKAVASLINQDKFNPIPAIAVECLVLMEKVMNGYRTEREKINMLYSVTHADVNMFFQGFSIPIIVLINSCKNNLDDIEQHILALPEPFTATESPFNQNQFLLRVIYLYNDILKSSTIRDFMTNVSEVFNFCEKEPLFNNEFYRLGITAAQTIYREFYTRITLTPTAFTY